MPPKRKREVDGEATEGSRPGERVSEVEGDEPSAVSRRESPSLYERRALGENIILGMTGSVASIKAEDLIHSAVMIPTEQTEVDLGPYADVVPAVRVVATKAAKHFFDWDMTIENCAFCEGVGVYFYDDEDDWREWKKVGDPVLHIELRRWADIMVVAPCSALCGTSRRGRRWRSWCASGRRCR